MRVFVTGAAGFIGSEFVRGLLRGDFSDLPCSSVTAFDALTYAGRRENLAECETDPRFDFVHGNIADRALLDQTLPGHDLVINFAAESHVDRSIDGPLAFVDSNVVGAFTLMQACQAAAIPRVVQVGTDEVYGSVPFGSSTEESALAPNSPYSASKAAADLFARSFSKTFDLNVVVTRCTNNYGPFQFPEKLIPLFLTNLMDGKRVPLYGSGENIREWVHVSDHCRGIAIAATRGASGEIYNIGGGTALSNIEITNRILSLFDRSWDDWVTHVSDRLGHDLRYSIDDTKLRQLGYAPAVTFEAGLASTVAWYESHQDWWRPLVRTP